MIPVQRDGVSVRYLLPKDHAAYIALEMNPGVRRYIGRVSTDLGQRISQYLPNTNLLAVAEMNTDQFIGRCGLIPLSECLEIHCVLEPTSHGKGIGQVVFSILTEIALAMGKAPVGIVHPENSVSVAILRKLGYTHVGECNDFGDQHGHHRYVYVCGG
jgi:RimJ/RimL family protein N-acetyltransferase